MEKYGVHIILVYRQPGFNHTAVQWWQLSTAGAVLQRGRIDDPAGLISRYYPTIAVNPAENVIIGYTISLPYNKS